MSYFGKPRSRKASKPSQPLDGDFEPDFSPKPTTIPPSNEDFRRSILGHGPKTPKGLISRETIDDLKNCGYASK